MTTSTTDPKQSSWELASTIVGMTCASYAARIEKVNKLDGVSTTVNTPGTPTCTHPSQLPHDAMDHGGNTAMSMTDHAMRACRHAAIECQATAAPFLPGADA